MSQHEAFLKAMRVEPNDPFHETIYSDFLKEQGYDPPWPYLRIARLLAPHLHSSKQALALERDHDIGLFGVEILVSCSHLRALRQIYLSGRVIGWTKQGLPKRVKPNIGEDGVVLLVGSPLLAQIKRLDIRCNHVGERGVEALLQSPYLDGLECLDMDELPNCLPASAWDRLVARFGKRVRRTLS